ncbi:hypothetical protein [Chromobacterium sp. IIBBL 290-4]|uniref:hypothetical protein n=1 Tax=Chromobacterium sp. IIBBL 290-4 TaxID=2953890 RepID=UPI0020B68982|nr:hypothetical protein [Chromobacterium sp. IIBBL 290-4]UTH73446.1 hypothetical protein NKT35_18170 [Chromobacterium sp. IIBBL 290-4]
MFDYEFSETQFLMMLTALAAGIAGYMVHALLVPWLRKVSISRLRHFQPHPYRPRTSAPSRARQTTETE